MLCVLASSSQSGVAFAPRRRASFFAAFGVALLCLYASVCAQAQFHDTPALHPPAGSHVAIVEFADLQCPACAQANTLLEAAATRYKIPWVRHDYLIPYHLWSFNAAVKARWFDTKSKALGDQYRDAVFANQNTIYNLGMLSQFTEKFARSHGIVMPTAIDPQGKLAADVQADNALGKATGITQTPTVFIVTSNNKGTPFIRVNDIGSQLNMVIDQAIANTRGR
ncbi:MAG: thioredoxin domain-containing protein [Acidobacteriaceae bacterium]|nr:thioredoxin domain-containing protein [Acidobacteriaceae bacterium]